MIYEFETDPETTSSDGLLCTDWHGKLSVDLTWVAAAQPYSVAAKIKADGAACAIMMAGSGQWRPIRYPYDEFMRLWVAARKGLTSATL